ncbi:MAG: hypothetical protein WKF30_00810 [Pyrinomonadaceae bacterium]
MLVSSWAEKLVKIYLLRVTDDREVFGAEPAAAEIRELGAEAEAGGVRGG